MLVILDGFTCHIEVTHIMINCGDDDALISRATSPSQISKQNTMTLSVTDGDHGDDGDI